MDGSNRFDPERRLVGVMTGVALIGLLLLWPQRSAISAAAPPSAVDQTAMGRAPRSVDARRGADNQPTPTIDDSSARMSQWTIHPACPNGCEILNVFGQFDEPWLNAPEDRGTFSDGSVATPVGATYSLQHLVGADLDNSGNITCRSIAETPPTGAPDDIVFYDGLPEAIRTDIFGTVPTVVENKIDHADGTHRLIIDTSSPEATDLFPTGIIDETTQIELTDACLLLGLFDPLDWPGVDTVLTATISFLQDEVVIAGPIALDPAIYFSEPWNGLLLVTLEDGAGNGINGVHLEIEVEKVPQTLLAACCVDGVCIGDVEEISCNFQGGKWHLESSCGADPSRPAPICNQVTCSFDNGPPLDDGGAPNSQYSPDTGSFAAAADDFILLDDSVGPCRINAVHAWMTHTVSTIDPATHYDGVTVAIYADRDPKRPGGQPSSGGRHLASVRGGLVYAQTIPMVTISVTSEPSSCLSNLWRLEIPIDLVLRKNFKYWLEVQPIMDQALGRARAVLSQNANDHPAMQIGPADGIAQWQQLSGNADACPDGPTPTPSEGTRRNLAFRLFGDTVSGPPNNGCGDAIEVSDGVVPTYNIGATTDGPDEPDACGTADSQIGSDVWYNYVATCTGDLTLSMCDSAYDTKIGVYQGCSQCPPRPGPIVCNDDFCGDQSEVTLPVENGDCYRIRVGGWIGTEGHGILELSCVVPPPVTGACCDEGFCLGTVTEAVCDGLGGNWYIGTNCNTFTCPVQIPPNDECVDCIPLTTGEPYTGVTLGATGLDVSSCAFNDRKDVWHCWTSEFTGFAEFTMCESEFDTTMTIYDGCDGNELNCNDDGCSTPYFPTRSKLSRTVVDGATYYIRVAGYSAAAGRYTLEVNPIVACCRPDDGLCALRTPELCLDVDGMPGEPGSACLGDHNGNGRDDACEICPEATINGSDPPDGVIDARQPNKPASQQPRQGIGAPDDDGVDAEPIFIQLDPPVAGAEGCFHLCETVADGLLGPNAIQSVQDLGGGQYEITLSRAITANAVTTINYKFDGSFVTFTSHPANANGDDRATPVDVLRLIDYRNGVGVSPWGLYSEDIDHSEMAGPQDILRLIDLLNGAGELPTQLNTDLPTNTTCPDGG